MFVSSTSVTDAPLRQPGPERRLGHVPYGYGTNKGLLTSVVVRSAFIAARKRIP